MEYIIEGSDSKIYRYDLKILYDIVLIPGIVLGGAEVLILFLALFRTADVRRRLKPLNDLAVAAEKLSKEPVDHNKIDNLERAISHLSADGDEQMLDESIEALKNESQHMKELVEQLLFLARGDSGFPSPNGSWTHTAEPYRLYRGKL